jgi:UDP:flavonoid glycosyltransferase YjiC (YdhE family)
MSDILFVTWDGGGNVPPALGIAAELGHRGHGVRFLGHERQRAEITGAGFEFSAYERALPFSSHELNPPERMVEIFNDTGVGEDLVAGAASAPTDVVVVDCLMLGGLAAARGAGLTYVPLEHFYDGYFREHWLRAPFGQVAQARGHDPVGALDAAPMTLVASLPELDPGTRGAQAANLVYCGPVVSAPTSSDLGAREPAVLVSLSTYNFPGQTEAMQTVLDAVDGLQARVVVTTGPVIDAEDLRVPRGVEVHRWVDHDLLMPEVTMVFGHGGHATTMRALAHDLPLAVMPQHPKLDQSMVGQSVEDAGAGRLVPRDADAGLVRDVIDQLLSDGAHRGAAASLGAAIRDLPGAATAADRLEALVRDGVPTTA